MNCFESLRTTWNRIPVGTRSVLVGAHAFWLHPFFVALAWYRLYGMPWDPRLWVAFFVHDLGYVGKINMDGPEGETHVELGARIMGHLFDDQYTACRIAGSWPVCGICRAKRTRWRDFCLFHSRYYAKQKGAQPSRLCHADKLAIALTPAWLYLPMVRWTGEIREYMKLAKNGDGKYATMNISTKNQKLWYADVQDYLRRWVEEHEGGRDDTWTPETGAPAGR